MNVRIIIAPDSSHRRRIDQAVAFVNGCQRYYRLTRGEDPLLSVADPLNAALICRDWEGRHATSERTILVTEALLDDNWFSHEYRDTAIVTIGDWERLYAPPSIRAYLMYQVAQALIHFAADMSEEMALNMVHEPAVGCVFDMAVAKPDIKYGMIAGHICPTCVAYLRTLGTSDEAVDALISILDIVRREALAMPVSLSPDEAFVVMRFSSNDENDHAWLYGIRPGGERCGLRVIRGDNRVESGQLLDKIQSHIARSRLVVAKIDQENLNVYFELGLAMGMKKDVLLISEESLVVALPSDLRNWECLTYPKGNYEELAVRFARFLGDTYGMPFAPH